MKSMSIRGANMTMQEPSFAYNGLHVHSYIFVFRRYVFCCFFSPWRFAKPVKFHSAFGNFVYVRQCVVVVIGDRSAITIIIVNTCVSVYTGTQRVILARCEPWLPTVGFKI